MDGVDVLTQKGSYPFFSSMTEEQKEAAAKEYSDLADKGLLFLKEEGKAKRLLVLDEVLHAIRYHLLPEERLLELLSYSNETREIVLTGYNPSERILAAADYITEMQKVRHPYDVGITSREGIEW
jgi:cob(I)alamin adenosyltransferase